DDPRGTRVEIGKDGFCGLHHVEDTARVLLSYLAKHRETTGYPLHDQSLARGRVELDRPFGNLHRGKAELGHAFDESLAFTLVDRQLEQRAAGIDQHIVTLCT